MDPIKRYLGHLVALALGFLLALPVIALAWWLADLNGWM